MLCRSVLGPILFNIMINGQNDGMSASRASVQIKLGGAVGGPDGCAAILSDFKRVEK